MKNEEQTMLDKIEQELRENIDFTYERKTHLTLVRYKDYYGVRTAINREISLKYFKLFDNVDKQKIFKLCGKLLKTKIHEKKTIAFHWAYLLRNEYIKDDFPMLESWIYTYVNNYGLCDDFCGHALGEIINRYSEFLPRLHTWIKADNLWVRRAAPVVLIYLIGKHDILDFSLNICQRLFGDPEDLVQKGYGWLLKNLSMVYEDEVFKFLCTHKKVIPRVALRYATEKMTKDKKQVILRRDATTPNQQK